jgi:hypothetical protein
MCPAAEAPELCNILVDEKTFAAESVIHETRDRLGVSRLGAGNLHRFTD